MSPISSRGDWAITADYLKRLSRADFSKMLNRYGQDGVNALRAATPVHTGLAASSWGYKVSTSGSSSSITWTNTDTEHGFPVAIMIQYGHGTGTGGYVQGIDYINPAMRSVFDKISSDIEKAVKAL
jgi:hypothetical protein